MAGKFLSPEEAATQLGVSIEELHRLVDRKKLFPMRDGSTLKFKADDIDRHARAGSDESSQSGDLSLELDIPETAGTAGGPAPVEPTLGGIDVEDLVLGDAVDVGGSIFAGDGSAVGSDAKTILRGEGPSGGSVFNDSRGPGLSAPSLAGGSAADIIFNDSTVQKATGDDDLAIESITGASSPALGSGPITGIAGGQSPPSGTVAIDLADVTTDVGRRPSGPAGGLSGTSNVPGSSLSGVLDSGLSLEGGSLQISGIDLGAVTDDAPAPADGGTVLAGDDFELGGLDADDESASVVIASESESGDSSFFGQTMVADGSSFSSEESVAPISSSTDSLEFSQDLPTEMRFSVLQVCGLVCCSLLLLFGGFVMYDLVRTIGSPAGTHLANPLLNAMADTFGWR